MGHTPGPWECAADGAEIWPTTGDCAQVELARVVGPWCESSWYSKETALANARLIAAAPELLAALKRLVDYCNNHSDYDAIGAADGAIRKAEGRDE